MRNGSGERPVQLIQAAMAGAALFFLSPLLGLISLLVILSSRGSVLHRARRTGFRGRTFVLLKFRTMVEGAHEQGPGVTGAGDPRITSIIGALLRRTKVDELPQLINVLRGDMRFVGPRPEDPRYLGYYSRDQLRLLDVLPGITSPASLQFIDEEALLVGDDVEREYVERVLPAKLDTELAALDEWRSAGDILVVARTLMRLARSSTHSALGGLRTRSEPRGTQRLSEQRDTPRGRPDL